MVAREAAAFMRAFGDATRLRVIGLLAHRDLGVSELARLLGCPPPRASRHLHYLEARGVVASEPSGNAMVYSLASAGSTLHENVMCVMLGAMPDMEESQLDVKRLGRQATTGRARSKKGK